MDYVTGQEFLLGYNWLSGEISVVRWFKYGAFLLAYSN